MPTSRGLNKDISFLFCKKEHHSHVKIFLFVVSGDAAVDEAVGKRALHLSSILVIVLTFISIFNYPDCTSGHKQRTTETFETASFLGLTKQLNFLLGQ